MAIENGSSSDVSYAAHKTVQDETMPLLPTKAEEDMIQEFNGASFSGSVFNLSTTIVGAGIMALPASIKMLGLIPGILMIIIVALLTEASIDMLVRCSHQGKITSYGWLMGETFGEWGRIALQASVVINNIGVLIVYMIIIGMLLNILMLYAYICMLLNIAGIVRQVIYLNNADRDIAILICMATPVFSCC
jgi:solute carrier family 38 (sodium-coupled neutral amino acid transporter), member 2